VNRFLTRPGPARWALGGGLVALLVLVLFLWWRDAPPPAPPLLSLLPRGSVVTSQARGAAADLGHAVLAGYDHWGHRWRLALLLPLPEIPASLQVGPLLGSRDAVVFPGYAADGTVRYRVVGLRWGRSTVLYEGRSAGPVEVVRGVIAERDPAGARGLRWDGRTFRPVPAPPPLPPAVVWYYWTDRDGIPHGESNTVVLVPGQRLVTVRRGGGPTVLPVPDGNLHVLGGAFRAHRPGTYTLTVPDFADRPGASFRLAVEVEDENP